MVDSPRSTSTSTHAACRDQISKINFRSKLNFSNLTSAELTAIKSLRKRKDIVIKQADKGGGGGGRGGLCSGLET